MFTDTWQGAKKRPAWAGLVTIVTEEVLHVSYGPILRPTSVRGIVAPGSTKGRKGAPEPSTGFRVSTSKPTGNPLALRFNARNTGRIDLDKGHIMALELGGPDIPENIVPQWSYFQRTGKWKRMENAVRAAAEKLYDQDATKTLTYLAVIHYKVYKDVSRGTYDGVCVPKGFTVYTIEADATGKEGTRLVVFEDDQAQDATDDMMALRAMKKADQLDSTKLYPDITSHGSGKKQKLTFVETGQSRAYAPMPVAYTPSATPVVTKLTIDASARYSLRPRRPRPDLGSAYGSEEQPN